MFTLIKTDFPSIMQAIIDCFEWNRIDIVNMAYTVAEVVSCFLWLMFEHNFLNPVFQENFEGLKTVLIFNEPYYTEVNQ